MRLKSGAVSLILLAVLPAFVAASEFTDYRIPPHRWSSWSLGTFNNVNGDGRTLINTTMRDRSIYLSGSTNLNFGWDSDPWRWEVSGFGAGSGSWRTSKTELYVQTPLVGSPLSSAWHRFDQRSNRADETWQLAAFVRGYPGSNLLGFEIGGVVRGRYDQEWDTRTNLDEISSGGGVQRAETQEHRRLQRYGEVAQIDAAVGYGRVRDATPVFDALLLAERLARDGAIRGKLEPATIQRLAELFAIGGRFGLVHNLPDKFFWREIERVLREEGALDGEGIEAFALRHADDPLPVVRGVFRRQVGGFIGPAFAGRHRHDLARLETTTGSRYFLDGVLQSEGRFSSSSRLTTFSNQLFVGARGEFHLPAGRRTQFDFEERVLVDPLRDPASLDISGLLRAQRLVAERWYVSLTLGHGRVLTGGSLPVDGWTLFQAGEISYYLEDFCWIFLEADHSEQSEAVYFVSGPAEITTIPSRSNDFHVGFGVSVGRGRLTAPGGITPQRPLN